MATITMVKDKINHLNQAAFQILCDALLSREGYPNIVSLGTMDGSEKTTPGTPDTYFKLDNGQYVFAEYTTQKQRLMAKIRDDLDKCMDEKVTGIPASDIAEIIYCHTSSNLNPSDDREIRLSCENVGIKLSVYGIDTLADRLMRYPTLIKDHLNLNIDTEQIQTADDFINQYDSNPLAATLETDFLFRKKETSAINQAFEQAEVVILTGPAGIGKTRLALEYSKKYAAEHAMQLRCIHDRALPIYEDLRAVLEVPDRYFLFVDDANQLSQLRHIIEYVNKDSLGYQVKVLITVRDYALPKVKSDISGITKYRELKVPLLTDAEISTLMQEHFGILNHHYLERIVSIADGNARIAMLAGKIAKENDRLDSINDVSDLYTEYYGKILHETGIDTDLGLIVSVGIMAFLTAIHLDHVTALVPILELNGLSIEDFKKYIHVLHEHEIVDICHDKGVRFSEQCMANYVLKYVFYDKKAISLSQMVEVCFETYHERTIHAINTLLNVYRNIDLHEYIKEEINTLWAKLEREESPSFIKFIKTFFPMNPVRTLVILQGRIDKEQQVELTAEDINTTDGLNYQNVSDEIITILGGFADTDNLDAALDLFFKYYQKRPDLYMQFYHAATMYYSIGKNTWDYGYNTQIILFTKIFEHSEDWKNPLITLLFVHIAEHFLSFLFSSHEGNRDGKSITMYQIPLGMSPGAVEYRMIIWTHLLVLAKSGKSLAQIKKILQTYGNGYTEDHKEIIQNEAKYIEELLTIALSQNCVSDCLIAQNIHKIFSDVGIQSRMLNDYLSCNVFRLYQICTGYEYDLDLSHTDNEKKREEAVIGYVLSAEDPIDAFHDILHIYVDSVQSNCGKSFELAHSVNDALVAFVPSTENYLECATAIIMSDIVTGIDLLRIVDTMFSFLSTAEVYSILSRSHITHRNEWLYAFYHEFPENAVSESVLTSLYEFLSDDSDQYLHESPFRDIEFLDRFVSVDADVILKASTIILAKKRYSPFIVNLYFYYEFNEYHISPDVVIQKYTRNLSLLEQIYLCVEEQGCIMDYQGNLLQALFHADKSFNMEYARHYIASDGNHQEMDNKIILIYGEDDYCRILDYVTDELIKSRRRYLLKAPNKLKQLLSLTGEKAKWQERRDTWIKHYIELNCYDSEKMRYFFETLLEISLELTGRFIAFFAACNDDFSAFDAIPLTPLFYSWSNSAIPLFTSWIEYLEKLLPQFSGLRYIRHNEKIRKVIQGYRTQIQNEEIQEMLRG